MAEPVLPPQPGAHESRLAIALRELLQHQRVAALGTLDGDGLPFVSMVPFALEPVHAVLVLHVSGLAAHTGNLMRQPQCSVMVMQAEQTGQPVHALPRITLHTRAEVLAPQDDPQNDLQDVPPGNPLHAACRAAYLQRFPEAEPMTALPDFRFVALHPVAARQVAGFGAARSVDVTELRQALARAQTPLVTAPKAT